MDIKRRERGLHLPNPPEFYHSQLHVPSFFHFYHPYTKWMINMIRSEANFRINMMIKERPELFQQFYQIPDMPEQIQSDWYDAKPMFNKSTVLYFNPLCLAIYMKKLKVVDLIIKSGVNHSYQQVYATEVYRRGPQTGGDILQIFPICICIAQEFFECVPRIINSTKLEHSINTPLPVFSIKDQLDLNYENRNGPKVYRYKDTLAYAVHTLKRRGNFPLSRLLDVLFSECTEFQNGNLFKLDEDNQSLFRQFAHVAYYDDQECRMSLQLIQCMEVLLKNKCYPWKHPPGDTIFSLHSRLDSNDPEIIDQDSSLGLLLALYSRILNKVKNGPLDYLADLLNKVFNNTQWRKTFLNVEAEDLHEYFCRVPEYINIAPHTITLVKRYIQSIIDLAGKERDSRNNHRRSCSLVGRRQPLTELRLLSRPSPTSTSNTNNRPPTVCLTPMSLYSYRPSVLSGNDASNRGPHATPDYEKNVDFNLETEIILSSKRANALSGSECSDSTSPALLSSPSSGTDVSIRTPELNILSSISRSRSNSKLFHNQQSLINQRPPSEKCASSMSTSLSDVSHNLDHEENLIATSLQSFLKNVKSQSEAKMESQLEFHPIIERDYYSNIVNCSDDIEEDSELDNGDRSVAHYEDMILKEMIGDFDYCTEQQNPLLGKKKYNLNQSQNIL